MAQLVVDIVIVLVQDVQMAVKINVKVLVTLDAKVDVLDVKVDAITDAIILVTQCVEIVVIVIVKDVEVVVHTIVIMIARQVVEKIARMDVLLHVEKTALVDVKTNV